MTRNTIMHYRRTTNPTQEVNMSNTTLPAIGSPIDSEEAFDALPLGTVLRDRDGWHHTKVANSDANLLDGGHTSTFVNPQDDSTGIFCAPWSWDAVVFGYPDESEVTPRPKRALTHETSREYALRSNSRSLPEEQRRILDAAAKGEEVDVFEFRKAATAALSLAATRAGQSMGRREFTKMARHLIYWADAILENHLDGLPVYAEGDRSRAVESLKRDVNSLTEAVTTTQAALDQQTEHVRKVTSERDEAQEQVRLLVDRASNAEAALERALAAAAGRIQRDIFNYALSLLSLDDQQRVAGYADGINGETAATAKF